MTRWKGVRGTPPTSSRTSRIQIRRSPSEPKPPWMGLTAHIRPMGAVAGSGSGMESGSGASQSGGLQVLPGAFSVRRRNWQEALAELLPPENSSASAMRMRPPSRIRVVFTSIGSKLGRRYMSTVRRAGMKSSEPNAVSRAWPMRPMTTRPCRD